MRARSRTVAEPYFEDEEFSSQRNWRVWRDMFRRAGNYNRHLVGMGCLAVMLAVLDVGFPLITREIINDLESGSADRWGRYVAMFFGMTLIFSSCVFGFITLGGRISTGFSHDIRQAGFARLQELSFNYFNRRPVGWLVTRLTSDCDRLSRVLSWGVLDLVWGTFFLVFATICMVVINWKLSLVVLAVLPPLAWLSLFFQRRLLHTNRAVRKTNSNITAGFNEAISGIRTTKTLVREDENLEEFREKTGRMFEESVRNAVLSSMYLPIVMTLGSLGAGLALWAGGVMVQGVNGIQLGTLVLFVTLARQMFFPIQELARLLTELQAAQAAAERVQGLIDTQPDVQDTPEVKALLESRRGVDDGLAPDGGETEIHSVDFAGVGFIYPQGQEVLRDFHLHVEGGQTVALVGPTGGGKTTIVSLLCRFYEPTTGEIRINGVDYRKRSLLWLQSNLGIVLQQPQLFSGSIRENIRYGRLDATDDEVEAAAQIVCAEEFILPLQDGYETEIGEGGGKLSTGQKQLISFARAVLADPQIFVMDEATSSVDTETEQAIQKGLREVLRGRMSFVIAHRLSTIRSADRILVIHDGRIAEDGSHEELIDRKGEYYRLYTNQFTRERSLHVLEDLE